MRLQWIAHGIKEAGCFPRCYLQILPSAAQLGFVWAHVVKPFCKKERVVKEYPEAVGSDWVYVGCVVIVVMNVGLGMSGRVPYSPPY